MLLHSLSASNPMSFFSTPYHSLQDWPTCPNHVLAWVPWQPGSTNLLYILQRVSVGNFILRAQMFSYSLFSSFESFTFKGISQLSGVLQHTKHFQPIWDKPPHIPEHIPGPSKTESSKQTVSLTANVGPMYWSPIMTERWGLVQNLMSVMLGWAGPLGTHAAFWESSWPWRWTARAGMACERIGIG